MVLHVWRSAEEAATPTWRLLLNETSACFLASRDGVRVLPDRRKGIVRIRSPFRRRHGVPAGDRVRFRILPARQAVRTTRIVTAFGALLGKKNFTTKDTKAPFRVSGPDHVE